MKDYTHGSWGADKVVGTIPAKEAKALSRVRMREGLADETMEAKR